MASFQKRGQTWQFTGSRMENGVAKLIGRKIRGESSGSRFAMGNHFTNHIGPLLDEGLENTESPTSKILPFSKKISPNLPIFAGFAIVTFEINIVSPIDLHSSCPITRKTA